MTPNSLGTAALTDTDVIEVERKGSKSIAFLQKLAEYITTKFSFNPQWSGQFYDTTTQVGTVNVDQPITFNSIDWNNGVTMVNGSQITVQYAGRYNIQFSLQLAEIATGTAEVSIWFRKNGGGAGGNITNSCTDVIVAKSAGGGETFAAWNFAIYLLPNEYVELIWSSNSANTRLLYNPTRTAPIRPAVPSAILTVQQIP